MGRNGFEGIEEFLGLEIIDKKSNLISDNLDRFVNKTQLLLEKPDQKVKENLNDLLSILYAVAWNQKIYTSSLQQINKLQVSKEPFSYLSIPVIDVSNFKIQDFKNIFEGYVKEQKYLVSFGFDFSRLDLYELLLQISRMLSAALNHKFEGPIFLQANALRFDADAFENDREALLENLKKKTRNAIQLGFYNINYDASDLINNKSNRISEKMLMNLKMVAMATNLWVRNFQPIGITVSVSGKMGLVDGQLPSEGEMREYTQRLLKEGSRLRFGVAGEDVSKVEIAIPDLNELTIERINNLNTLCRQEFKLGGLVVNVGKINDTKIFSLFSKLNVCELKICLGEKLVTPKHMKELFEMGGIEKMKIEQKTIMPKADRMATAEGLLK
jgi:hypothetical protein